MAVGSQRVAVPSRRRPVRPCFVVRFAVMEAVPRRSLSPLAYSRPASVLPGWMDPNGAAHAGQLFAEGPAGALVIDQREILTSTARVVGATLGELPLKVWMALVTLHVAFDHPIDGRGQSTAGHLGRLIWGNKLGGDNTRRLVQALMVLWRAELHLPGYNSVKGSASDGISVMRLVSDLHFDQALLTASSGNHELDRRGFGKLLGDKGPGTVGWQLNDTYVRALGEGDLQRFDWTKVHELRGVALALWLVFTSPRIPYRAAIEDPVLQCVEVELSEGHCRALGVTAAADGARRRTFNQAGERVRRADADFCAFEAHGGRGLPSFLRVVRRKPHNDVEQPRSVGQLALAAA